MIHLAGVLLLGFLARRPERHPDPHIDTPGAEADPDETHETVRKADELFDPAATARFVSFWIIGPSAGAVLSYLFFTLVPFVG